MNANSRQAPPASNSPSTRANRGLEGLAELRRLKQQGRLSAQEQAEYEAGVASVLDAFLEVQNASVREGQRRRATIRVRRAVQVEVAWPKGHARALTLDLGRGGFSTLLGAAPPRDEEVVFELRLSGNQRVTGRARTVAARPRNRAYLASFQFTDLSDADAETLQTFLVDEVLSQLLPARPSHEEPTARWLDVGSRAIG